MKLLKVGKIVNTFGLKGELKILSDSDFLEERFKKGTQLYLEDQTLLVVSNFRNHKGNVLIKVNDLNDINEVEKYKTFDVFVDQESIEPLKDDFYLFQLEDLEVYVEGKLVGKVIEVLKPAQTILRIELEDREIMIPFVDAFVEEVDLENNCIHVNLIEGL